MSEGKGFDGESPEGQGPGDWPRRKTRELREQAEMAWSRVQQVMQRGRRPGVSTDQLLDAVESLPTEGYLGGIAAAIITASWLHAMGYRTSATVVGVGAPLLMGAGLYLKISRQPQTQE
jgi:hypothetical protein